MSTRITVDFDGSAAQRAFAGIIKAGRDPRPALRDIGGHLRLELAMRFLRGIAPDGTRWKPSKRAKAQAGGKGKTLVDRGHLRDSFNAFIGRLSLVFGSNSKIAAPHQFGVDKAVTVPEHTRRVTRAFGRTLPFPVFATVRPHKRAMKLPARAMIGWTATDDEAALDAINRLVLG